MNLRGIFLAENVVKIVISVLSILILVFLLASLYSLFTKDRKLNQAQESLDKILSALKNKELGDKESVVILGPTQDVGEFIGHFNAGWVLVEKSGKICICLESRIPGLTRCDDYGKCILSNTDYRLLDIGDDIGDEGVWIRLKDPPINLEIKKEGKGKFVIKREKS